MLRLPPTGLAVSQSDLQSSLQHLDFYTGLLKQGFKRHQIAQYLRENAPDQVELGSVAQSKDCAPSTYDLTLQSDEDAMSSPKHSLKNSTLEAFEDQLQYASPVSSSPQDTLRPEDGSTIGGPKMEFEPPYGRKQYAPRQSSLLRFARGISSEPSEDEGCEIPSFTRRQSMTYRPRSETYSYDQSVLEESDSPTNCATPVDEFDRLPLDSKSLEDLEPEKSTAQTVSILRPNARSFTPLHIQSSRSAYSLRLKESAAASDSDMESLPSSPPLGERLSPDTFLNPSPVTPIPRASSLARDVDHTSSQTPAGQQFLDGSFTVYNDSVPAQLQPQTPADLSRGRYLDEFSAAYTAPPGMIRSSATQQGISSIRQTSDELSPVVRAAIIRERRQREFARGLRVEELRIDRAHIDRQQLNVRPMTGIHQLTLWRDDLDADGIGEENFEELSITALLRGMRVVSGNRRAT